MTDAEYHAALDRIEAALTKAYLAEIKGLIAGADIAEVRRLVSAGDIEGLARYFESPFTGFAEQFRQGYIGGGLAEASTLPARVRAELIGAGAATFNPEATNWARENMARFLVALAREQRDALQVAVTAAQARPDSIGDIVVRVIGLKDPVTGQRTGGVLGLAGNDARAAERAREQLLSGDAPAMREYLARKLRDKRSDGMVKRAIEAGKPVARVDVDKIVRRYSDKLLRYRAEVNAQIEALGAYNAGRNDFYAQLLGRGIAFERVQKTWRTQGDRRVRDSHRDTNGQEQVGGVPFRLGSGALMQNPGDRSLGAGLADVANCRCRVVYKVLPYA